MRRILLFFMTTVLILIMSMSVVSAETYTAGDRVHIRYPASGMLTDILEEPKFVRYSVFNPEGTVVYEVDHELTYKQQTLLGTSWMWYDETDIVVPGFAQAGTWKIEGRLWSSFFSVITTPSLSLYEKTFEVTQPDLWTSLTAPFYYTLDMGPAAGRFNLVLPVHPYLIIALAVVIIAGLILILKAGRTPVRS